ncbi:methylmalonyl Co-A mutase-associated GTPase MeaB [Candidatus Neomarinimicrobiota bacterium]
MPIDKLIPMLLAGDNRMLARAISMVENELPDAGRLLDSIYHKSSSAYRLGITGPPGAGKSSLVDRLIGQFRAADLAVGIISVDPTSPFSGGALLGDRFRMSEHYLDARVFIRSMASRGDTGGLAARSQEAGDLVAAAGYDVIIFETVGVGQVELDVMEAVDSTVVVLIPESGDEIQLMKAGIVEIADIFVINKSDREGAKKLRHILEQLLDVKEENTDESWRPPVCNTSALKNEGIEVLHEHIQKHLQHLHSSGSKVAKQRARFEGRVRGLIAEASMASFWNGERTAYLKDHINVYSPYELARNILEL